MKAKCIIVEDEILSMKLLENYCIKSGLFQIAGTFPNAEKALEFLQAEEEPVQVIFLDVDMPGLSGFQLLDQLTYKPEVILTTSNTDYAFTAFEYHVTDFLKKPIGYKRFQEAAEKLQQLHDNANTEVVPADDIFIKADGKLVRVSLHDIYYIECLGDYVKYITSDKNYITYTTMKSVEERLNKQLFLKVHRSYIINMKKIKDIEDNSILINGKLIPISRANKPEVMQRLKMV